MYWHEITKDTPLEEIKRIHQQIWQYAVDNGKKPKTPYINDCVACEYVKLNCAIGIVRCFDVCPIAWSEKAFYSCCGVEYQDWFFDSSKINAEIIRDIPFKYEFKEK